MTTSDAFPTWRTSWMSLDGVQPLLENADSLLHRRARGNHHMPKLELGINERLSLGIEALRRWTEGEPPADISARPAIARRIYLALEPTLRSAVWARWILLERAFFDASRAGDLLFSALAIRTMCEEVQRLLCLDLNAGQIEALAASGSDTDYVRLILFMRAARANLDEIRNPPDSDPSGSPDIDWAAANWPRLQTAKQALNDYVHPNYGSHISALFPERASAARILLEGIIAAYEAFLNLSWVERPLAGRSEPPSITPFISWPRTIQHFLKRVLPDVNKQILTHIDAGHVTNEVQDIFDSSNTIAWLTSKDTDAAKLLSYSEIADLVDSLRITPKTVRSKTHYSDAPFHLWDGAQARDVLSLAMARRAERILTETFPDGEPDRSQQKRWLEFISRALQLAVALYELKTAAFKVQLVRQLVSGNSLGILLCVRSLIEHKAVASWLVSRLGSQWSEVGKRVKPGADLPTQAQRIEEDLAKFLASTKGSAEDVLPWVTREVLGKRVVHLSLPDIVNGAFKSADRFAQIYDVASAALHGRMYRGLDLLAQRNGNVRALGVLVLEWICDQDERMDLIAQAFVLNSNIEHAAAMGGAAATMSEAQVRGAFGHFEGKLKTGRDYTGDGSREDPFCFRIHLQGHQASKMLLQQMSIEWTEIQLAKNGEGRLCDCYQTPDREWWFVLPEITTS